MIADPRAFIAARDLGPDAFEPGLDLRAFRARLHGRRGTIKAALMDQTLVAGIGNMYSDEILFQARIHPLARVEELTLRQTTQLHRNITRVLAQAIRRDPASARFLERLPRSYLLPHRVRGGRCPRCHARLERTTISGRTSFHCPRCQVRQP
jgi:formamidopyrimidine-DNA glycosylase